MSALSTASIGTALITAPFHVGAGIDLVTPRVGFSVLPALGDRGIVDARLTP